MLTSSACVQDSLAAGQADKEQQQAAHAELEASLAREQAAHRYTSKALAEAQADLLQLQTAAAAAETAAQEVSQRTERVRSRQSSCVPSQLNTQINDARQTVHRQDSITDHSPLRTSTGCFCNKAHVSLGYQNLLSAPHQCVDPELRQPCIHTHSWEDMLLDVAGLHCVDCDPV